MMNMDYISVIDNFVETVSTPILVIDDRSYVISSNKAAVDLLGSDFKDRHFYVAIRQPLIINLVENAFTAKGNEKENFYKTVWSTGNSGVSINISVKRNGKELDFKVKSVDRMDYFIKNNSY